MKTLFDGTINIHYRQFYISLHEDDVDDDFDMESYFIDQTNGLIGAAQENYFFINAPSEVSVIQIKVSLLESAPDVDDNYEEIVEVSALKGGDAWYLAEWGWEATHELSIPSGEKRVRLSIEGFDLEYSEELQEADEEYWEHPIQGQSYLVEIWPAPLESDKIVKQTSAHAKYVHDNFPITKADYDLKKNEYEAMLEDDDPWWKFW